LLLVSLLRGPLVSRARGLFLVAAVVEDAAGLVGGVVGERLEDGVGDGRRHGQVGALRLEAVLVGGVGDGVADVVGRREGEGALRGQGTLRAVVHQLAALLGGRAILRLIAETNPRFFLPILRYAVMDKNMREKFSYNSFLEPVVLFSDIHVDLKKKLYT